MVVMGRVVGIGNDLWISSAALLDNGNLVSAIAEERINRIKGFQGFPRLSIGHILEWQGLEMQDIDLFCVGWNPSEYFNALHPRFSKTPRWRAEMLYAVPNQLISMCKDRINIGSTTVEVEGLSGPIRFYDHHMCH